MEKEYTWRQPWSWTSSVGRILPWYPAEGSRKLDFGRKAFGILLQWKGSLLRSMDGDDLLRSRGIAAKSGVGVCCKLKS